MLEHMQADDGTWLVRIDTRWQAHGEGVKALARAMEIELQRAENIILRSRRLEADMQGTPRARESTARGLPVL